MAFKIKDNLDLYGNQLLNFALQSDSGFPQSPQVGHMFNYTGTGVMANHAVMCVDETTKAFKALAFVDEIATNAEFVELKEKVDLLIGDDVDTDTIIDSWKEVQAFLADIEDTKTLQGMLSSYLPLSGGILRDSWSGGTEIRRVDSNNGNVMLSFSRQDGTIVGGLGFGGIDNPIFVTQAGGQNALLHSGNYATEIGDYYLKSSGRTRTITSTDNTVLILKTDGWHSVINFQNSQGGSVSVGYYSGRGAQISNGSNYLSVGDDGVPYFNTNTLLHSGNIGEYKAGGLAHSNGTVGAVVNESGNVTIGASDLAGSDARFYVSNNETGSAALGFHLVGASSNAQALGSRAGWAACIGRPNYGLLIGSNSSNGTSLLQVGRLDNTEPRTMALQPLGGNVLIGTTEDNGGKLQVDGYMHIKSKNGYITLTNGMENGRATMDLSVHDNTYARIQTLLYGVDYICPLALNPSGGNVLIGTTTDNGAKLQISSDSANIISLYRTRSGGGALIDYFANNETTNQWRVGSTFDSKGSTFVFNKFDGTTESTKMLINSSGNVTIGDRDSAGTNRKLVVTTGGSQFVSYISSNEAQGVALGAYVPNSTMIGADNFGLQVWSQGDGITRMQVGRIDGQATAYDLYLQPLGGNVRIFGNLIVDGNIVGKKEVSAGGAGQEGESGDGGAEVISQQLASGQSTYTITNTIKRSDIAVSLYEWNANNGSWDMCLADISVKDATITVTFGSATSVNHKLVAVG